MNFTARLHPIGTDPTTSARRDFGTFDFLAGQIFPTTSDLRGLPGNGAFDGRLNGYFFGPTANEIAGEFEIGVRDNLGNVTKLTGVTVAKRR
jgi:hypothetical protein